ncbi:histidine kinase [Amycolatopsis nigrescens]|uniref:histidine kinase n=1 Tax=Amycolatopsis nigrescens TaxID=381445 RepID=UPI00039E2D3F|nr:histidine kinase [Amycolatopsis nigrescens]
MPAGDAGGALVSGQAGGTGHGAAFWALGPAFAAAVGLYFRYQQNARDRAVAAARRAQRLDLARDLHDYVAHDLSEMIAQAQAAQLAGEPDPAVLVALRRIETAGLKAMSSMDRTVHMLHEDSPDTEDEPKTRPGSKISASSPAGSPRPARPRSGWWWSPASPSASRASWRRPCTGSWWRR